MAHTSPLDQPLAQAQALVEALSRHYLSNHRRWSRSCDVKTTSKLVSAQGHTESCSQTVLGLHSPFRTLRDLLLHLVFEPFLVIFCTGRVSGEQEVPACKSSGKISMPAVGSTLTLERCIAAAQWDCGEKDH